MDVNLNQQPIGNIQSKAGRNIVYSLIGIAIIVILGEAVWAFKTLQKNSMVQQIVKDQSVTNVQPNQPGNILNGSIILNSPKKVLSVGEKLTVTVHISSADKSTDGTDLVLSYDPKILTVETIGTEKKVMAVSDIYPEYPGNGMGEKEGLIKVSGISSEKNGTAVNGVLGSIIFSAKTKGKTNINVEFSPGATSESNIVETHTGHDLLGKVENLEVEVK